MKTSKKEQKDNFKSIINLLKDLNTKFPDQNLTRHIVDATTEYHNLWLMPNSELEFALTKYKAELDLNIVDEKEVDKIYKDGLDLENSFNDEEEY